MAPTVMRRQEHVEGTFDMSLDIKVDDQTLHCTKLVLWSTDSDDPDDLISEAFCTVHYQDDVEDHPYFDDDAVLPKAVSAWFEQTHPEVYAKLEAPFAFTEAGQQGHNYAHLIAGTW